MGMNHFGHTHWSKGSDNRIVASHKVMGLKTHTAFPKELLKYLYLTCLLNEQGNVGTPLMEENFVGKVNESVSEAIRRITGWKSFYFPFCVILNLEYFLDDERQRCRELGYFTNKHIPFMKVLPDYFE